jgi:predicted Rossmann fold nucleotide-binding protein DprA/Smf involved in DNA uptake
METPGRLPTRMALADCPAGLRKLRPAPPALHLLGNPALLRQELIGLLCSRRVPAVLDGQARSWARAARDLRFPTIGGFLSPVERECLEILLEGTQPVVICLARGLAATRIPPRWRTPLERGRMLLVSPFSDGVTELTSANAELRNRVVAALARELVVPHAAPGGRLLGLLREVIAGGKTVHSFDHPANAPLLRIGCRF